MAILAVRDVGLPGGVHGQAMDRAEGRQGRLELRRVPDDEDGGGVRMEVLPSDSLDVGNRDAAI